MMKILRRKIDSRSAVLVVCLLVVLIYFGFQIFKNYETRKEEQNLIEWQKEQEDLEKELKEKFRDQELVDLKQQLSDLKNKPSEIKTVTNTVTVEAKDTITDIVKEWSPRVAHMECSWLNADDLVYAKALGSVTLVNFTNLGIKAVTNKHILVGKNNYAPKNCNIKLFSEEVYPILISENNVSVGEEEDWAYISLPTDEILTKITRQKVKLCSSVEIGDKLLVLGYPKIGSKTGLTVTDGIVSGIDKNYYITSAKIDKGNSGGAAILTKDDCYLGIPSASAVGAIESLGRILKASFVLSS